MKNRLVALLVVLVLAVGLLPAAVWANGETTEGTGSDRVILVDSGSTATAEDGTEAAPYKTLEAAFAAAAEGDTVKLLAGYTLTQSIAVDKTVVFEMNGKTVVFRPAETTGTASAFVIQEGGKLTVHYGAILGSSGCDSRAFEGQSGSVLTLDTVTAAEFNAAGNGGVVSMVGGTLTIKKSSLGYYDYTAKMGYGNAAYNGGAVYLSNSEAGITDCRIFYNKSTDPTGSPSQHWFGGGAVYAEGKKTTLTLSGNYFFDNESEDYGGAVHLDAVGKSDIRNNRFVYSIAANHRMEGGSRGGDGGALYIRLPGEVSIVGNTISNNTALSGNGGGVMILGNANAKVLLDNNIITKNYAGGRGGGLCLRMPEGSSLQLLSGEITENKAYSFGAGIDYTGHDMTPLHLTNVLITDNTAARGAGIWSCPASETESYSTLGGAIFGIHVTGTVSNGIGKPKLGASGDDVRYEGKDTPDTFTLTNNPPSDTTHMTVSTRVMGGGRILWYQDEAEDRYTAGDPEAPKSLYTDTSNSFGLHGELSEAYQTMANSQALLIISGNKCNGRGGGIASNSPVVIGLPGEDVSLKVTKTWADDNHPDEVKVDLYRIDEDGSNPVKLDSDVVLNEANGWTATFTDLPSQYIGDDKQARPCRYEVEEQTVEGWKGVANTTFDKETRTYNVSLRNERTDAGSLTLSKTVSGIETEQAFSFRITLTDKTGTPLIGRFPCTGSLTELTFDEDGTAEVELSHGESLTITGLPGEAAYTVTELDANGFSPLVTGGAEGTIEKDTDKQVNFENRLNQLTVSVRKEWNDKEHTDERPEAVIVELLRGGEVCEQQTLSEENGWAYTWEALPRYDEDGSELVYTLREQRVDGYRASVEQTVGDGTLDFVVTNTYKDKTIPETGALWWPVALLVLTGMALLAAGSLRRSRKRFR